MSTVSIIGLGKLGACMAAVYASKGHNVIGVDINSDFVSAINDGRAPVKEQNLQERIDMGKEKLSATEEYAKAISQSDITFIIVPTPTDESGGFSTTYVEKACESIGQALAEKNSYHVVVLTSTVLPGDCDKKIIPVLEKASGKVCGKDFGFCYSPEFIAIGTVVQDLLTPDFFLLGSNDDQAGAVVEEFYATVCDNNAPVQRMSIPSAELTKISLNSYVTMKITFANMLAEVAHHIPGVNIDDVTTALGNDKRIGKYYLRAGLGFGGPCFPRDNRAFAEMASRYGLSVPYASNTDSYNKTVVPRMVELIKEKTPQGKSISILGLSYKPGTALSEESQAIDVTRALVEAGYDVHVWNPGGNEHAKTLLGESVTYHDSLESSVKAGETLFLSNWDKVFQNLPSQVAETHTIIDPWRQFTADQFPSADQYISYGIGV